MTDLTTAPWAGRRLFGHGGGRFLARGFAAGAALLVGVATWGVAVPSAAAAGSSNAWTANFGGGGNAGTNAGESVITAATAPRLARAWIAGSVSAPSEMYAPAVAGGTAYQVTSTGGRNYLSALSPRTGVTKWSVALPNASYFSGLTVTGHDAIISFSGSGNAPGGLFAVDLSSHSVLSMFLPPATAAWMGNAQAGLPYTDGTRVYVKGAGNDINAYRLSDGGLDWTVPLATRSDGFPLGVDGMAIGAGVVYTAGGRGLIAYDSGTGQQLWSGTGGYGGTPVVAGGRVFVHNPNSGLAAFPAAGCGATVCGPIWTSRLTAGADDVTIGSANAFTVFVTYHTTQPPAPGSTTISSAGVVARLGAATGKLQWRTSPGTYTGQLVRGGNTIWLLAATGGQNRILGYSISASGPTPLASIRLPQRLQAEPQTLAIASGTLFQQVNGTPLVGYRIPGT